MLFSDLPEGYEMPLNGIDYGVPPQFMLMANPAFAELWQEAKCQALGYLRIPRYKSFVDIPGVALSFEDFEKGCRFFDLIKSWDCEGGSGCGTDIAFIEDSAAKSYTMTIGPNYSEMIKRLLDPAILEDFSVLTSGMTIGKTCALSPFLGWLREQAKTKPIAFMPGSSLQNIVMERAFFKNDVRFFEKGNISKDTVEYAMVADDSERLKEPRTPPIDPSQIATRRTRYLKRFFAVTMARLEDNPAFRDSLQQLSGRYEGWQVTQGACNLLSVNRFPEAVEPDGKPEFYRIYDLLRQTPEVVSDASALVTAFTPQILEKQIREDMNYLCARLQPNLRLLDPEPTLRQLGILR